MRFGSLNDLKNKQSDIEKVQKWLAHIGETDSGTINEVIEICSNDKEARLFFTGMFDEECGNA